jgi:hypothetical protein
MKPHISEVPSVMETPFPSEMPPFVEGIQPVGWWVTKEWRPPVEGGETPMVNPPLRWSSTPPTEPGWYWYKPPYETSSAVIWKLEMLNECLGWRDDDNKFYSMKKLDKGQWAGPIPLPQE